MDKAPELADKARATKVADAAVNVVKDIGFAEKELAQLWNGEASVSLRDHRVQLLILDGVKYREAKTQTLKPAPKPVPQVLRPGVAEGKLSEGDARIQELQNRFNQTGNPKDGAALLMARRAVRR